MRQYKTVERVRRNAAKRRERIRADPNKHEAQKAYMRAYRKKHLKRLSNDSLKRYRRNSAHIRLQRKGLSSDLIERVENCDACDICGGPPVGRWKQYTVDHDHETGEYRGMLCSNCNVGLGLLKDSPEILHNAIEYLTRNTNNG